MVINMKIEVKLFFDLRKYLPLKPEHNHAIISVPAGATVQSIINQLKIPSDIHKTILLNGRNATENTKVKENDSLAVFPPMAGG